MKKMVGELARCQSGETGAIYVLKEDGTILRMPVLDGRFREWKRFKVELVAENGTGWMVNQFKTVGEHGFWKTPMRFGKDIVQQPTQKELEEWLMDGVCEALDGCRVEPDGVCPHGFKSWMLMAGVI